MSLLEQLQEAFPGSVVEPEFISGPVLGCAHCGRQCATHVPGEHEVWASGNNLIPARVVMVSPTTPMHRQCWRDWAMGRKAVPEEDQRLGAYARRS